MKFLAALAPCLVCVFLGCGGDKKPAPPKTYPVTGKLVGRDGKLVRQGTLEFRHTKSDDNTIGDVEKDGTFNLRTVTRAAGTVEGAPEGEYTVTYIPGGKGETPPVTLKKKYTVKEGANNLTVTLD